MRCRCGGCKVECEISHKDCRCGAHLGGEAEEFCLPVVVQGGSVKCKPEQFSRCCTNCMEKLQPRHLYVHCVSKKRHSMIS